jgi:hypothetical protein
VYSGCCSNKETLPLAFPQQQQQQQQQQQRRHCGDSSSASASCACASTGTCTCTCNAVISHDTGAGGYAGDASLQACGYAAATRASACSGDTSLQTGASLQPGASPSSGALAVARGRRLSLAFRKALPAKARLQKQPKQQSGSGAGVWGGRGGRVCVWGCVCVW